MERWKAGSCFEKIQTTVKTGTSGLEESRELGDEDGVEDV